MLKTNSIRLLLVQQRSMQIIGAAMVGVGTAITASLVMCIKAAADEEQAMLRLSNTLMNVGVSYKSVKDNLDKSIMSMEKATAVSHDELYSAFNMLLIITSDYNAALRLLPVANDLAAATGMDLATAAKLVGKAEEGNIGMLARYGIVVKEGATQTEVINAIIAKTGGSAEAMAKGLSGAAGSIGLSFDALKEAIGVGLLESLSGIAEKISKVIYAITDWATKNPELTAGLVAFAGILGLIMIGFGTFILLAPGIAAAGGLIGGGIAAAIWPITLVIAAIAALIAIGVLLWKNWDKIVDFFTGSHRQMTKVAIEELDKQTEAQKAALKAQGKAAEDANTKALADLKKKYGVLEGYTRQEDKTLMDLARDASAARGKEIDRELDAIGKAHDAKMRMIDEEYQAKVDALDAETNAAIGALEGQLSAMDAEDKATARSTEDQADYKRLQQIQNAITNATNVYTQMSAQKELDAFNLEMAAKQKDRDRTDERESIQSQIAALREAAANQKTALQTEHDAQVQQENDLYNAVKTRLDTEKTDLDTALQAELTRLELERQAYEKNENDKLAKLQQSLAEQDAALTTFHDKETARLTAGAGAKATTPTAGTTEKGWWQKFLDFMNSPVSFQGYEGRIPGVPGTPILATVHAGEYIGQGGGNTVNIYNPSVRSDQDITEITRQVTREMERMRQTRYG